MINNALNLPHYCLGPQDLIHTIWRRHLLFDIWLLERLWCSNFWPNPKNCTKPGLHWKAAIIIWQKGNNCSRVVLQPSSWHIFWLKLWAYKTSRQYPTWICFTSSKSENFFLWKDFWVYKYGGSTITQLPGHFLSHCGELLSCNWLNALSGQLSRDRGRVVKN